MNASMSTAGMRKRQRTEAQLARKRQLDRANYKMKRDQAKAQMDHMVNQIHALQERFESVSYQVQRLEARVNGHSRDSLLEALGRSPFDLNLSTPAPQFELWQLSPAAIFQMSQRMLVVDCRCGVPHRTQLDCLEYTTVFILLETHESLAGSLMPSIPQLPRTPSLIHIFRPFASTNPVSWILASFIQQVYPPDIRTLFALYLVMYRFLRWRLYPDGKTYQDVPAWLYPTEIQETIPHPVCVDFIPWPALREYIVTRQRQDSRHSVKLYMRSMVFRWPAEREFVTVSSQGELLLHPCFEREVYCYENWRLGGEWAQVFPRLTGLVNLNHDAMICSPGNNPSNNT